MSSNTNQDSTMEYREGSFYNTESRCNRCPATVYWNKGIIDRMTKRQVPLSAPYYASTGTTAKRHRCMPKGKSGMWINKYEYSCNLVREDDFNRYFEVSENNKVRKVIERKQYWHKPGWAESLKQKDVSYVQKWKGYSFQP